MLPPFSTRLSRPEKVHGGELDKIQDWVDWLWTTMSTRAAWWIHSTKTLIRTTYRNKQGWVRVAQKAKATFSIRLKKVEINIRYIPILSMTSYGKGCEGGRLRMTTPKQTFA
jgi:hypothetical protein